MLPPCNGLHCSTHSWYKHLHNYVYTFRNDQLLDLTLSKKVPCYKEGNHSQRQFSRTQTQCTGNQHRFHVISGFRREADANCALLGYCAVSSGNFVPTFRDNLPVPPSGVKNWRCVITENSTVLKTDSTCSTSHPATPAASQHEDSTPLNFNSEWYTKTVDRRPWKFTQNIFFCTKRVPVPFSLRQATPHCDNHCCLRPSTVISN